MQATTPQEERKTSKYKPGISEILHNGPNKLWKQLNLALYGWVVQALPSFQLEEATKQNNDD